MSPINDRTTINREDFNKPIQYVNDFTNNNPMRISNGVYNQKQITYKHSYTLFVPSMTPQYTSSRYANKQYCLFYVNHLFASNNYV